MPRPCDFCGGDGFVDEWHSYDDEDPVTGRIREREHHVQRECRECDGTGEVPYENPVAELIDEALKNGG